MKLTNTLTGRKEEFAPLGDVVKMYVCGPTPYDVSHVGHAMSYVIFDVIRRYLESLGYKVRHVQNFTDVDDKIIARAREIGVTLGDLAEQYIQEFLASMDSLNVQRAHVYPRATQEIEGMIEIILGLLGKGYAYRVDGDIYFRVRQVPDYGKLAHRDLESMQAGARVELDERKEYPMDFALWKGAKEGEPAWASPWGPGRPGWHIECSAMSLKYLGEQIDLHGGGQDLIFPHHENELAQTESYTGKAPFVRHWLHNGLLQFNQEKMSKSLGNLVTVREMLDHHRADAFRLFVLSSHYHSPLNYSEEALNAAERGLDRLLSALEPAVASGGEALVAESDAEFGEALQRAQSVFAQAMEDDVNTPSALAACFELAREINRWRAHGAPAAVYAPAQRLLLKLGRALGFTFAEQARASDEAGPFIDLLVEVRQQLRQAKQWALADKIRERLAALDVLMEDGVEGTRWRWRR
ncbi:MAG: cysteine--tRNA ligase [Chloroflexi bacterium]|nr:cysteine--tRNA ligase [Chloroflexota bacterium]